MLSTGRTERYDRLKAKQKALWGKRYEKLGIEIEGDEEAEKAVFIAHIFFIVRTRAYRQSGDSSTWTLGAGI